jgi:uncharacterized membrane protein
MGWRIAAEISSYRLRAKTLSIAVITQTLSTWLTTFVVPYIYSVDSGNLGARTGFIFAGTSLLLIVGIWFLVPDMTGITTNKIDRAYAEEIPARRLKKGCAIEDTSDATAVDTKPSTKV